MKKIILLLITLISLGWTFAQDPMILHFDTRVSDGTTVALPLFKALSSDQLNVDVDWGDDSPIENVTSAGNHEHTYAVEGEYTVKISGNVTWFGSWQNPYPEKLISVSSFGNLGLTKLRFAFYNAAFLQQVPNALPSAITDLNGTFIGASSFNQDISSWNVSNVKDMQDLFFGATSFNQDIGSWEVKNVTNMSSMFRNAKAFNQNIGGWNVSKVTNINNMFNGASSFNQDISNWNVGNVTSMNQVFNDATSFNQNLEDWDVSKVTNMYGMFSGATSFNQNIGGWNVSNVTDMQRMFAGATVFNKDISGWNTANVTIMNNMFRDAISFNQDISSWDLGKVINTEGMFSGATSFNQDIGGWDVSKVTQLNYMFYNAKSFDQNLSNWEVGEVYNMIGIFKGVKLSTINYSSILISWSDKLVRNSVNLDGGDSKYSAGAASVARQKLIDDYEWIIIDGGESNAPVLNSAEVTDVTPFTAIAGGEVTAEGDTPVSSRGVVWSTIKNPTIENNIGITNDGVGAGAFVSNISGLSRDVTYFVRAYAINESGVDYGPNKEFRTLNAMSLVFDVPEDDKNITLPLNASVDVTVDWGDGNSNYFNSAGNQSYTYSSSGIYTVNIWGSLAQFGNGAVSTPNIEKLTEVKNFGSLGLQSLSGAFNGATQLTKVPAALPNTIIDLSYLFNDCHSFNQSLGSWSVSNVTNMANMLSNVTLSTTNYNNILLSWSAQNVKNGITFHAGSSKYSPGDAKVARQKLISTFGWNIIDAGEIQTPVVATIEVKEFTTNSAVIIGNVSADGGLAVTERGVVWSITESPTIEVNDGIAQNGDGLGVYHSTIEGLTEGVTYFARAYAINSDGISYGENLEFSIENSLTLIFDTSLSEGTQITIPFYGSVDVTVEWGDGTVDSYTTSGLQSHIYLTDGVYTVNITGNLTKLGGGYSSYPNVEKLIAVKSFGDIGLTSLTGAFNGAVNLVQIPSYLPSTVKDISYLFKDANGFNLEDIISWDVSNVTDMQYLFYNANVFNQDISRWNVSNVINMSRMFNNASSFNQDIGGWSTDNVTSMSYMFYNATSFNQDIGGWITSRVTNMSFMFSDAIKFNQNIGDWDLSSVNNISSMFDGASAFNQDISNWNVSNVTNMRSLFYKAIYFNQDISGWDVSNVTDFANMFYMANSFNKDISNWDVSNASYMNNFLSGTALHTEYYDAILNKWSKLNLRSGVYFSGGNSKYSSAGFESRQKLIDDFNWTITDGGPSDLPITHIADVLDLKDSSASIKVVVISSGASDVIEKGLIWGTSPTITLVDNDGIVEESEDVEEFIAQLTGLDEGVTYYVRAYAINSYGTDYSVVAEFTTKYILTIGGSFKAQDKIYDGTDEAVIDDNNLLLDGIIGGDEVEIETVKVRFVQVEPNADINVEIYEVILSGIDSDKYLVSLVDAPITTASINKMVGIETNTSEKITLYPNPVSDVLYFSGVSDNSSIIVIDLTGKLLMKKKLSKGESLNVSNLSHGLYVIQIITEGGSIDTFRIVKQ